MLVCNVIQTMARKHSASPLSPTRGRGAHSESLAMTFDKILFQSTLDLNLFMIRDYDCTSNEVQV